MPGVEDSGSKWIGSKSYCINVWVLFTWYSSMRWSRKFKIHWYNAYNARRERESDLALVELYTRKRSILVHKGFLHFISDLELVKLPEDVTLAGFTPLMLNPQDPCYVEKTEDMVIYIVLYYTDVCARYLYCTYTYLYCCWFYCCLLF